MTTPPQETTLPDEPDPEVDPDPEADDPEELDPDEPPKSWVDPDEVIEGITDEEAQEGRLMGERIDTADDNDGGNDYQGGSDE